MRIPRAATTLLGAGALVVLVALPASVAGAGGQSTDSGPPARHPLGVRMLDLVDESRATPADPEGQQPVAGAATRALPTTVWYPAAAGTAGGEPVVDAPPPRGRFPLVLFSGGAPGTPDDYAPLLRTWAAAGYVVVAPQFPVSSLSGPDDVSSADQRDQVRDARFVLDRVLALDREPRDEGARAGGGLGGIVDPTRIAAAGHSLGGLTTLALVSDCCRDRRIDAAVVLAGVHDGEDGPTISDIRGPVLFVHSSRDYAVPLAESERGYADATPPKYLVEVALPVGGLFAHVLPFMPGRSEAAGSVAEVTDAFLDGYLRGGPDVAGRIARAVRSSDLLELRHRT